MKLGRILSACALLGVAGCGEDANEVYELESGKYKIEDKAPDTADNCGLAASFIVTEMTLNVVGDKVTFQFGKDPSPDSDIVTSLSGNDLEKGTKTFADNYRKTDDPPPGFDCDSTVTNTISGELLDDNTVSVTLTQQVTTVAGALSCEPHKDPLGYKVLPCASTLTFTATKD